MEPSHPSWNFTGIFNSFIFCIEFYNYLAERGLVIYPGKLTQGKSFRIGSIGEIYEKDIRKLLEAIK